MTALLELADVAVRYPGGRGRAAQALRGVSLSLARGEALGIVGESGAGKSTLARVAVRLLAPSAGAVRFDGADVTRLSDRALRPFRSRVQIVFQDPASSLDPRVRVGRHLREVVRRHGVVPRGAEAARADELCARVGLDPELGARLPHELSAGQRQRVALARALAGRPELLVLDEPTSALDASLRAQVLELLAALRAELGLALLLVTHDLAAVEQVCERAAVLYAGRIAEELPAAELFRGARHPYARALADAVPRLDPDGPPLAAPAPTEPPSAYADPPGCAYAPRCPLVEPRCARERPPLAPLSGGADGRVACWLADVSPRTPRPAPR